MDRKNYIRKIIVLAAWFLVISGITTLLIAANRRKTEHLCRSMKVLIRGGGDQFFIEKNDIRMQLEKAAGGSLIHRPVNSISLAALERSLEGNKWIRDAELYFDREDVLHVVVEERQPVARVFTSGGASFYIDSSGHKMPLTEKLSARLPVITGYPDGRSRSAKDSAFLNGVKNIAGFIYHDPFWNAQIGQIDITTDRKIEMIPVIGDHIIRIGHAEKLEEKLHRLLLFYRQVMSKTGFHKYSAVDVQYDGQVIGVHKGPVSRVDSIQLQKNIEELLKKSTIQNVTDEMLPDTGHAGDSLSGFMTAQQTPVSVKTNPNPVVPDPLPGKSTSHEKQMVRKNDQVPKAVMKKSSPAGAPER